MIAVTAIGRCGGAAMIAGVDRLVGYGEGRGLRGPGFAGATFMLAVQTFLLTCVTLMLTIATFMLGCALFLLTAPTFQLTAVTFMLGRQLKG